MVDAGAFRNCTSLLSVSMHNSIDTISAECFEGCTALLTVSWPESLKTIEHDAFSGCTSLTGVPSGTKLETLGDNAFQGCTALTYADLPSTLTKIGQGAFAGCNKLQEIVIPDSVTVLGNRAFEGCSAATKLTLSKGVTVINNYCFSGCSSIGEINIPSNVVEIGREAFANCTAASIIRLPKELVQVGNDAFTGRNADSVMFWKECQGKDKVYLGTNALGSAGYIVAPQESKAADYAKDHAGVTLITSEVWDYVVRCYNLIQGRTPADSEVLYWAKPISAGKETGASIVKNFFDSNEFKKKNLSNEAKVKLLYQVMQARTPEAWEVDYWKDFLESGFTTDYVINGFATSNEFKGICDFYKMKPGTVAVTKYRDKNKLATAFVARCYTKALGRKYDETGIEYWCERLLTGKDTPAKVASGFVFSDEAKKKNWNNTQFLEVLYHLFFDREPDSVGMAYWLPKLNAGMKRENVVNGFASSDEFKVLLKKYNLDNIKPAKNTKKKK